MNYNVKMFSIYSPRDLKVVHEATKNNLYLIGGTAIELWLNHFDLSGWRSRSKNDIDFMLDYLQPGAKKDKLIFEAWVQMNTNPDEVKVDIWLEDNRKDPVPSKFKLQLRKGSMVNVMHPAYLFKTKLVRMGQLDRKNPLEKDRFMRDMNDLVDILKVVNLLHNGVDDLEWYLNKVGLTALEDKIQSVAIDKYNRWYKSNPLNYQEYYKSVNKKL